MTTEENAQDKESGSAAEPTPAKSRRSRSSGGAAKASGSGRSSTTRRRASKADSADETNGAAPLVPRPLPRLLERLRNEIGPTMIKEFGYTSPMQIPKLDKIVLNIGLGETLTNPRAMENATRDLTAISGQRPLTTRAKKSIAGFKIREGMPIGLSVTLRSRRMYEFLDRFISSTLPRIRDFQGVSRRSFDGRGNYSLGLREQVMFPEIDYNSIDRIRGMQIVIVTTAFNDQEGLRMLELMGMPFAKTEDVFRNAFV